MHVLSTKRKHVRSNPDVRSGSHSRARSHILAMAADSSSSQHSGEAVELGGLPQRPFRLTEYWRYQTLDVIRAYLLVVKHAHMPWRYILNNHNHPAKCMGGPINPPIATMFETALQPAVGGLPRQWRCTLKFVNLFEAGDTVVFEIWGVGSATSKTGAEMDACGDLVAKMFRADAANNAIHSKLRLRQNHWNTPVTEILDHWKRGFALEEDYEVEGTAGDTAAAVGAVPLFLPPRRRVRESGYVEPMEGDDRDLEVIAKLDEIIERHFPEAMPFDLRGKLYKDLDKLLPPDGLLPFLKKHSLGYTYKLDTRGRLYSFTWRCPLSPPVGTVPPLGSRWEQQAPGQLAVQTYY